jgi:lambda family phage portal protein
MMLRVQQAYEEIVDIRARDSAGRPQVIHVYDGDAEQVRGITPLAPALKIVRQFDQLADATLTAALIQAIFAATIESDAPTDTILQALQDDDEQGVGGGSMDGLLSAKAGWYDSTKIDLGRAGKIAHLFPGEKLTFNGSKTPNDTYEAFAKFLLREIARCLGMTFETLSGDYTAATYSSVRMSTSELWPLIVARRVNIPGRFYQQVFEAWLEEQIETGRTPFPGGFYAFLTKREAAARAEWRGPPKPQADDLKTQKAHEGYKRMGVMSDEMICNDLGVDVEDVYRQRAHEKKLREKLDLPDGDTMTEAKDDALVNSLLKEPE